MRNRSHLANNSIIKAEILRLQTKQYPIIRQSEQQFSIERKSEQIERSITRIQSQTRTAIEELDDLESRLTKSQEEQNGFSVGHGADAEIEKEFEKASSRRAIVGQQYTTCPLCEVKCLTTFLQDHILVCTKGKGGNQGRLNKESCDSTTQNLTDVQPSTDKRNKVKSSITVCPQPPRNLRVNEISHDSVLLSWDPPILEGGEPIIDYEILFKSSSMTGVTQSPKRKSRVKLTLHHESCCRWCEEDPIPTTMFRLDGLEASKKYFGIKIRCKNKVGWSRYSNTIEYIETADPVTPSPPQTFQVCTIASTFIVLSWTVPYTLGGGRIKEYHFQCEVTVPNDKQESGVDREGTRLESKFVKIPGDKFAFRIDGLVGDCIVRNLQLYVVNHFGLKSICAEYMDVKTLPPSRIDRLQSELERVQRSEEEFIDSDFFQNGVVQREERSAYLQKLQKCLREALGDNCGESDASKTCEIATSDEGYLSQQGGKVGAIDVQLEPTFRTKVKQYQYRIDKLRQDIDECKRIREEHCTRRSYLTFQMAHLEKRSVMVQAELNTALDCNNDTIVSNILNSTRQRFFTKELIDILRKELKESSEQISKWKHEIVDNDKKCAALISISENKEQHLKERLASFQAFKAQMESATMLRLKTTRNPLDYLRPCFRQLSFHSKLHKTMKRFIIIMEKMQLRLFLAVALSRWKVYRPTYPTNEYVDSAEEDQGDGERHVMLKRATAKRHAILADISSTMKSICDFKSRNLESDFDNLTRMGLHLDIKDLPEFILDSVRKGDFYHDVEQYRQAKEHYEYARNVLVHDLPPCIAETQSIEVRCMLDLKISRSCIKARLWNSALLYLDSLLHMAEKLQSNQLKAITYVNLGECHLNCREYMFAADHFLKALPCSKQVHDSELEARIHEGLASCHEEMGNKVLSNHSKERFDFLMNCKESKIKDTLAIAESMTQRLCGLSAQTVHIIDLEKTSSRYLEVVKKKGELEDDRRQNLRYLQEVRSEVQKLNELSSQIDDEVRRAKQSGKRRVASSLLHDSLQKFDLQELLKRLSILADETKKKIKEAEKIAHDVQIDIKNMDDDIHEFDQDLLLERGALTQRVLAERHIRSMSLNWSSILNNNVSGKGSFNFKPCAYSIDKDLYVHNIENGRVIFVGNGDEEGRHIGDVYGHTAIITAVFVSGIFVYTGSVDTTIICWDIERGSRKFTAKGHHRGTITCIFAQEDKVISGSADTSIILWDVNGYLLRQVFGHNFGVLCAQCGPDWYISGDADGNIIFWDEEFQMKRRMKLKDRHKVTVVKHGANEIITGDSSGDISIWFVKTGELINSCKAHYSPVSDLHFDATKLVTCGLDCLVKVIDVTTCQVLHTLRGHEGPVLCVAFDNEMIITASKDWTIRCWLWNEDQLVDGDKDDIKKQKKLARELRKSEISRKTWTNGVIVPSSETKKESHDIMMKRGSLYATKQGLNDISLEHTIENSLDSSCLASRLAK